MGDWHPYGNPNAKGEPGHKSAARAEVLRAPEKAPESDPHHLNDPEYWKNLSAKFDYEAHERSMEPKSISDEERHAARQEKKESALKKLAFIHERLSKGETVNLATGMRVVRLSKQHMDKVRVKGSSLEVEDRGKWVNADGTHISAG